MLLEPTRLDCASRFSEPHKQAPHAHPNAPASSQLFASASRDSLAKQIARGRRQPLLIAMSATMSARKAFGYVSDPFWSFQKLPALLTV